MKNFQIIADKTLIIAILTTILIGLFTTSPLFFGFNYAGIREFDLTNKTPEFGEFVHNLNLYVIYSGQINLWLILILQTYFKFKLIDFNLPVSKIKLVLINLFFLLIPNLITLLSLYPFAMFRESIFSNEPFSLSLGTNILSILISFVVTILICGLWSIIELGIISGIKYGIKLVFKKIIS